MLSVPHQTKKVGDDKLWSSAGTRSSNGCTEHIKTIDQIVTNGPPTGDAIPLGPDEHVGTCKLAIIGGGVGELIVGHYDNNRKFFHSRHIHPFMEASCGCPSLANTSSSHDTRLPAKSLGHQASAHG